MMKAFKSLLWSAACSLLLAGPAHAAPNTPFADNNGTVVPPNQYSGPFFKLSHDYPATAPVPAMPWRKAINNGRISTRNASAYAEALKQAVGPDMRVLIEDYANWNAAQRGWYNEPWIGNLREPIHGMYVGSQELDASLFAKSGLTKPITTYVLTYYDRTAAPTLYNIWGKTAMQPNINARSTQFAEGSVVVKASFITADGKVWPAMEGALSWPLYISVDASTNPPPDYTASPPVLINASFMQFDIIVKDSASAPATGWVFTTLVYDKRLKRGPNGIWDQMVVLGAQWGNDPQAKDPSNPRPKLLENWNNPAAPLYGGETFGWGERLSGPNDGAMNDFAYSSGTNPGTRDTAASRVKADQLKVGAPVYVTNGKNSSCMSCHSTAQWNPKNPSLGMDSFLLPLLTPRPQLPPGCSNAKDPCANFLNSPLPGSPLWMKWFQNRKGDVPMDKGSIAADFDMVLTFKSLPAWYQATQGKPHQLLSTDRNGRAYPSTIR
ncbi:hypothetical protein [Paucibacter sp. B51]|uniref:hypothetical protein n=1 Tax=Paucibacter sp. B51 TaxID=2993315 RepID=UPI0022EBE4A6|nr:hypothetical protein [Paucibacter sp. B51]